MNFKVGDKVKLVKMENESEYYREYLGKTYTIESIKFSNDGDYATFEEKTEKSVIPYLKNLELIKEYTYEDLKKSPIGTKITFENGNILTKTGKDFYEDDKYFRNSEDFKRLKDNCGDRLLGKIIKIEEPEYTTVYERKEEILDEAEKRYLRNFIKPFRDKVTMIRKLFSPTRGKYYIQTRYKDDTPTNFPYFDDETMYQGMKKDKEYTLEELGL